MLRMMVGMTIGFVGGYLYGSERARGEARRRFANAQDPSDRQRSAFPGLSPKRQYQNP